MELGTELVYFNQARTALEQALQIDEVVQIRDKAARIQQALMQAKAAPDMVNDAVEIKVRAERRAGEMLANGVEQGHRRKPSQRSHDVTAETPPTLSEIGISKMQSSRWQALAGIPLDQFERTIQETRENAELSTNLFLKQAKALRKQERQVVVPLVDTCTVEDLEKLIDRGLKFGTIYSDPPWAYGNQGTRAATDNHYDTMTVEEIAALPVAELAAEECHMHMWTTNAFLHDSFHLLEHWGFEFKSLLVWDKDRFGIGNYWRLQTEYLLLGTRGGLTFLDHSQPNIFRGARARHSAKPEQVRFMIEKVSPGPRLELFARRLSEGWVSWGNEIERCLFDTDVKEVA